MMKYMEALITHLESMSKETKAQICIHILGKDAANKPILCKGIACQDCPFYSVKQDFSEIKTLVNLLT